MNFFKVPPVYELLDRHGSRGGYRRGRSSRDETSQLAEISAFLGKFTDSELDPSSPPLCAGYIRESYARADAAVEVKRTARAIHINEQAEYNYFVHPHPAAFESGHGIIIVTIFYPSSCTRDPYHALENSTST